MQLCVSIFALTILRLFRIITIPHRSLRSLSVLIFPSVFFIANVTVGLLALNLVNIPMFSAFRRLSVLSVILMEWLVLGKTASRRILYSICVMVIGSFLAGLGDVAFHPLGYALVFANNFITAGNLVSIKKVSTMLSLDALAMFYYVSIISLPLVLLLVIITGELERAINELFSRADLQTPSFAFALSLSAASAFLINFFTNLCTQLTSPLTTAITGQVKNVLQTTLGIFAFGYIVTPLNLAGLGIALIGSLWFARLKYEDARMNRKIAGDQGGRLAEKADTVSISLGSKPISKLPPSSKSQGVTVLGRSYGRMERYLPTKFFQGGRLPGTGILSRR